MDQLNEWGGSKAEDTAEEMRGRMELIEVSEKLDFIWPIARKPSNPLKLGA
jgi:hypothetical protein